MNKLAAELINNQLLEAMEQGIIPWRQPWKVNGNGLSNFCTKKAYHGVNVWILLSRRFASEYWLTYKQAQSLGAQVKEGEHGTKIVFWSFLQDKKDARKRIPFLKYYVVFNTDQVDGLTLPERAEVVPLTESEATNLAGQKWHEYHVKGGPTLSHGGSRAAYSPTFDSIKMPVQEDFSTLEDYYRILFHEAAHSTGAEKRLNRDGVAKHDGFGSDQYSKEELIAEIASCYLSHEVGIGVDKEMSAAYIKGWMKELKADPMLFISAAGKAEKAAHFFLGIQEEVLEEQA